MRFGQTSRSLSARSKRCAVLPALVQQVTPSWRIIEDTASTTSGWQLPTLFVPQPDPKSMKRFPSASSMSDPEAFTAMNRRSEGAPYAPAAMRPISFSINCLDRGPGSAVLTSETRSLGGMPGL